MEWINYHHLYYFWTVANEGSIAKAAALLRLAQPTISGQLRALEGSIGEKLFNRVGRGLQLTEVGRVVLRYADEIFTIGRELNDVLRGRPAGRPQPLVVGIANVVPKLVAYRLLEPALRLPQPVRIVCREERAERLLAELSVHGVDLVLSDAPLAPGLGVRAFSHLLGECGVSFFATPEAAQRLQRGFPKSLEGAPMLLPGEGTTLRRELEQWLDARGVRPSVVGEFDDSALLKVFGQAGAGVFCGPSAIEREIGRQYGVKVIGRTDEINERFYAISVERRIKNPAVVAISRAARRDLFG